MIHYLLSGLALKEQKLLNLNQMIEVEFLLLPVYMDMIQISILILAVYILL